MVTGSKIDYFTSVRRARFLAGSLAGSWNLVVSIAMVYRIMGQLEKEGKKFKNSVRFTARSIASRRHRHALGRLLAHSLLRQAAGQHQQRLYQPSCRNLQQVCSIPSLKGYAVNVRRLAGLLSQLPVR